MWSGRIHQVQCDDNLLLLLSVYFPILFYFLLTGWDSGIHLADSGSHYEVWQCFGLDVLVTIMIYDIVENMKQTYSLDIYNSNIAPLSTRQGLPFNPPSIVFLSPIWITPSGPPRLTPTYWRCCPLPYHPPPSEY